MVNAWCCPQSSFWGLFGIDDQRRLVGLHMSYLFFALSIDNHEQEGLSSKLMVPSSSSYGVRGRASNYGKVSAHVFGDSPLQLILIDLATTTQAGTFQATSKAVWAA